MLFLAIAIAVAVSVLGSVMTFTIINGNTTRLSVMTKDIKILYTVVGKLVKKRNKSRTYKSIRRKQRWNTRRQ